MYKIQRNKLKLEGKYDKGGGDSMGVVQNSNK